jgi:hypothetical protein
MRYTAAICDKRNFGRVRINHTIATSPVAEIAFAFAVFHNHSFSATKKASPAPSPFGVGLTDGSARVHVKPYHYSESKPIWHANYFPVVMQGDCGSSGSATSQNPFSPLIHAS